MRSMDCSKESNNVPCDDEALLPADIERFRMATLRVKLASYGVYAAHDANEDMLYSLLKGVEERSKNCFKQQKKQMRRVKKSKVCLDAEYFGEGYLDE